MKSIYLTGFMGVGKTTIGQKLAEKMQLATFDTDTYIEEKTGLLVKKIFEKYGEKEFRSLEVKALQELPTSDAIITTGGGIVTTPRNIEWMTEKGLMIFLTCPIPLILKRLEDDDTRPLLHQKNKTEMETLFKSRLPLYSQAHITVDTSGQSIPHSVEEVYTKIKSWQSGQH